MSSDDRRVLSIEDFRRVRERRRVVRQRQDPDTRDAQVQQLKRENRSMAVVAVTAYALGLLCGVVIAFSALNA